MSNLEAASVLSTQAVIWKHCLMGRTVAASRTATSSLEGTKCLGMSGAAVCSTRQKTREESEVPPG